MLKSIIMSFLNTRKWEFHCELLLNYAFEPDKNLKA
jgi:hypothetical protein